MFFKKKKKFYDISGEIIVYKHCLAFIDLCGPGAGRDPVSVIVIRALIGHCFLSTN